MLKKAINIALFLFLMNLFAGAANAAVPDWLHNAAQQPAKKYADDTNAVVLLDDQETTVKDNGDIVTHERLIYRILRPEGKDYARYSLFFNNETKVNYLHGWSITAKGQEYEAKDKDAFERSLGGEKEFSDDKEKMLIVPGAEVGTVVGFEYEQKRRPYLFQAKQMDAFKLSDRKFPVYFAYAFGEVDKVNITIPDGFTLESVPKQQNARLDYASYQNLVQFDGKKIVTQRILQVNGIFFRVELYPVVKDFFGKVQAGDEQQAVLSGGGTNAQKGN
jgi:hypothetical protein